MDGEDLRRISWMQKVCGVGIIVNSRFEETRW